MSKDEYKKKYLKSKKENVELEEQKKLLKNEVKKKDEEIELLKR